MIRNCSLDEISDGRLYSENDMVKADCNDCEGCSACCQGMGGSIVLDPYDIYQLTTHMNCGFEQLLAGTVTLNVVDGIILPNLAMEQQSDRCTFLNEKGRCKIHTFRPGICRLFPLGRYWDEQGEFHYILQTNECQKQNRTKIKVKKWLDTPELGRYNMFVKQWHAYLAHLKQEIGELQKSIVQNQQNIELSEQAQKKIKDMNMSMLTTFFMSPYQKEDFYAQFNTRIGQN